MKEKKGVLLLWIFFVVVVLCLPLPSAMYVYCSLMVACWKRAYFLVLMRVTFSWAFVTFSYGVLGQVWYLNAFSLTLYTKRVEVCFSPLIIFAEFCSKFVLVKYCRESETSNGQPIRVYGN